MVTDHKHEVVFPQLLQELMYA